MKKKGFTLIELLVVIAIIAMLLAILMPALNKVKKIAQRVICGTNLKGLGNAQMVYANDYDDEYVVQGGGWGGQAGPAWTDGTIGWQKSLQDAPASGRGQLTVGASLYLLVREADVSPKSFVCPAGGETEFSGKNEGKGGVPYDIVDLYDFGHPNPGGTLLPEGPTKCVSYSYHNPYAASYPNATATGKKSSFSATGSRAASFAVMADKNPYFDDKLQKGSVSAENYIDRVGSLGASTAPNGDWTGSGVTLQRHEKDCANAQPHGREGQNVLYADGHSAYETRSDVSTRNDNIYTRFDAVPPAVATNQTQWRRGSFQTTRLQFFATGSEDSVLVNDHAGDSLIP